MFPSQFFGRGYYPSQYWPGGFVTGQPKFQVGGSLIRASNIGAFARQDTSGGFARAENTGSITRRNPFGTFERQDNAGTIERET